jgi:ribosomal-protein-alanine N-acetyltransferase
MTEAVVVVNDYWFDVLGFPVLRAPKALANVASRRISEKTGMRLVATLERDYVSGRLPAEIWEITAEEWRAKRTGFNFERSTIHGRATISVRSGGCLF